jgi:type VI secretion system protein ImpJ
LRPQHFQQAEDYLENYSWSHRQSAYPWGFSSLSIDESLLALGKVALRAASGVFADGTVFHFSDAADAPPVLDIRTEHGGVAIVLALPIKRAGRESVIFTDSADSLARYLGVEQETADINVLSAGSAMIYCGKLRLRLLPENELNGEWLSLGALRIKEKSQDGGVTLDPEYIPPLINSGASPLLQGFKQELAGVLRQRRLQLSRYLQQCDSRRETIADLQLLALINRFSAQAEHALTLPHIHPEQLFAQWLPFALELTAFRAPYTLEGDVPLYDHRDAGRCFSRLMLLLRQGLCIILQENAIPLPLTKRITGLSVATLPDLEMAQTFDFILAVDADLRSDGQFAHFLAQIKIAPASRIRDLVQLQLPGIPLQCLAQAPKQLALQPGWSYIQLESKGALWQEVEKTGAFAFYLTGEFASVTIAFWAVRRLAGDGVK